MFEQFRLHYPKGSLITELLEIDRGQYIVRCLVQVEGVILVTGLAAAQTVELAEDRARERALAVLGLDSQAVASTTSPTPQAPVEVAPATTPEAIPHPQGSQASYDLEFMAKKAPRTTTAALSPREEQPLTEVDAAPENETETVPEPELPLPPEPVAIPTLEQEAPAYTPSEQEEVETFEPPSNGTATAFLKEQPTEISEETPPSSEPIDFSDIIARTTVELKRLGWTNQQGREYLVQTYGKRSRQLLTDEELLDFLHHLELEPTPQEQQAPQE